MRKIKAILAFLLPVISLFAADGSDRFYFDSITQDDGLPNSSVSSIQQDSKGYLWFGTQSGLARYDGYSFTTWEQDPFDFNSLPHELVQTLYIDDEDNVWIGTYNGLSDFDPRSGTFTNYEYDQNNQDSISNSIVTAIAKDSKGRIWAATLDGLNVLNRESGTFTRYYHREGDDSSLANNIVRSVYADSSGRIWIGTLGGMDLYNEENDSFTHFKNFPSLYVMTIRELDKQTLIVGTWDGGLSLFNTDTGSCENIGLADDRVYTSAIDSKGNIWIGTWGGGLFIYNRADKSLTRLNKDPENKHSIASDTIYSLLRDRTGIMWVGTNGGGISIDNPGKEDYTYLSQDRKSTPSIDLGKINTLLRDRRGDLWLGIYNKGINIYNRETNEIQSLTRESSGLTNNIISDMIEDREGTIWIGTNEGLNLWDPRKKSLKRFLLAGEKTGKPFYIYTALYEDKNGTIWAGTHNSGLIRYDRDKNKTVIYSMNPEDDSSLSDNLVYDILERRNGQFWIATNKGLDIMDRKTGQFTRVLLDRNNPEGINNNNARELLESSSGVLWVGTGGGGINRYNDGDGTFTHITTKDGLSDNFIMSLVESTSGAIWAGTKSGLSIIHPDSGKINVLDKRAGLSTTEFTSGAVADSKGDIYLGTIDRVYRFDREFKENKTDLDGVYITSMQLGGEKYAGISPYLPAKKIRLNYNGSRYLSFDFVGLNYLDSNRIVYSSMLEGFDRDWSTPSTRKYAIYTNIPPGKYRFLVKASMDQNHWMYGSKDISITISPPLWKTWWAYMIYSILFLLFLYLIISFRTGQIRKQKLFEVNQAQKYLSEILNAMPSIFIAIDRDQRVTQWNRLAEKESGIGADEAMDRMIKDIYPDFLISQDELKESIAEGRVISKSRKIERAENKIRFETVTVYPLDLEGSRSAVIRIDDVTKQVQMEEALVQSEKMLSLGGLAAGMAHEINNPLAGMVQNISVLKRRLVSGIDNQKNREAAEKAGISMEKVMTYLENRGIDKILDSMNEAGRRVSEIVKNMLSFARKDNAGFTKEHMSELVDRTLELASSDYDLKKEYDFKNIRIAREYEEGLPLVPCERTKIQQILLNILRNGAQAMRENKDRDPLFTIRIYRHGERNMVSIDIADNGMGMEKEIQKRIFEPFFTTKPVGKGTGLGLSLTYFIIRETHKGEITVKSSPGKGTTFTISLPAG